MHETDVDNPQPSGQVDGMVDGIADGIMAQLENTDPDHSGVAERPEAGAEEEQAPAEQQEPSDEETESDEETYTIKWQGQDKEVTQTELLELAQKGFDYTSKTQALAAERDQLAPYVGFVNQVKANPILASQIADLIAGKAPQAPQPPAGPEKPKFDDPIDQLKWEIKQEALAEARKEMQANLLPLHKQAALNQVRLQVQSDPDYATVHQQIVEMVKAQPPAIQKTLYLQLDQDPQAYMDTFQYFKNQKAQGTTATTTSTAAPLPKPLKRETHAPILETGGVAAPEVIRDKEKAARLSKQKAKALRNGDPRQIADWLLDSGAINHLL